MSETFAGNKKIWAAHCEKHYVPLYFHPWWMDCVCGEAENWGVCLSLDGGGNVEGALVFYRVFAFGLPVIKMPPLTAYSGLWLHPPEGLKLSSSCMAFEKRVCETLLSQLPAHAFFYQQWHPAIINWLPFFWKGFRQTTLYTYRLELAVDPEILMHAMNKSARKRIRKAASELSIQPSEDISQVFQLYKLSLQKQGARPPFSMELFERLDTALSLRKQRMILIAIDERGHCQALNYFVWDECTTHSVLGGIHPDFRRTAGIYLLFREALARNYGNSKIFDFEGSILESVEESLRSFGGQLTPHFKIFRAGNKLLQVASLLLGKEYS